MTTPIQSPPPGVYEDIPFETYLDWPYLSNSKLSAAAKSMAHFKAGLAVEETPQMRFGSLCHAGKLEPLAIPMRYVVMPAFEKDIRRPDGSEYDKPRGTSAYKALVEKFRDENLTKKIVTDKEYDDMTCVVRALATHERARDYFAGPGQVELCLVWDDPETGLRLKARLDMRQTGRVTDLKTCRDPMDFARAIAFRGYHRQAAMYLDGLRILTGDDAEYCLVAVENAPPWGVRAAPLSSVDIEAGREQYQSLLAQIVDCKASSQWPGYPDPDVWKIPEYLETKDPLQLTFEGELVSL